MTWESESHEDRLGEGYSYLGIVEQDKSPLALSVLFIKGSEVIVLVGYL